MRKFYFIVTCIVFSLLIVSGMQKKVDASDVNSSAVHIVQKGDTLWDICAFYYGDSELWPQLWTLNPFVTNPHLLKKGDIIRLFASGEAYSSQETAEESPKKAFYSKPEIQREYVDLKSQINTDYLGRLTTKSFKPVATLVAEDREKKLISTGDKVFVKPSGNQSFSPGDILHVYSIISYDKRLFRSAEFDLISIKGLIRITGKNNDLYEGRVLKSRMALGEDDPIIRLNSLSYYVELTEPAEFTETTVIGLDGLAQVMLSTSAVVYLDKGTAHGVSRGNVFALKKDHYKKISHDIPSRKAGYIIVLESYEHASMGIVLKLGEEVFLGAKADSLNIENAAEVVKHLPSVISKY